VLVEEEILYSRVSQKKDLIYIRQNLRGQNHEANFMDIQSLEKKLKGRRDQFFHLRKRDTGPLLQVQTEGKIKEIKVPKVVENLGKAEKRINSYYLIRV
jgi:hypothetical protein